MQSDNSAAESDLYITGRYCLDLWRLVRHEVSWVMVPALLNCICRLLLTQWNYVDTLIYKKAFDLQKANIFSCSTMHKNKPEILFAGELFFAVHYLLVLFIIVVNENLDMLPFIELWRVLLLWDIGRIIDNTIIRYSARAWVKLHHGLVLYGGKNYKKQTVGTLGRKWYFHINV